MVKPRDFIDQINTAQSLLGLDFGDKTIGIAVSDKTKTIASPIMTLNRKSVKEDIKKLLIIFKEYDVGGVVLGMPLNLDGNENERTKKVRKFSEELKKNIKVTFYDERYSSDVIYKELRKNSEEEKFISKLRALMILFYLLLVVL